MRKYLIATISLLLPLACSVPDEDTGTVDSSCSTHDECNDGLLCIASSCQEAFPRTYLIRIVSASIAGSREGGDAWDIDQSAPDAFVRVSLGESKCDTSTVQDSSTPTWNEACEVELFETSSVTVTLIDSDFDSNDTIGSWSVAAGEFEAVMKGGALDLSNGQATLSVSVALK